MKKYLYIIMLMCMVSVFLHSLCAAQTDNATMDNATIFSNMAPERFGRGVINIFSSPLELPAQMYDRAVYYEDKSENPLATIGGFIEGIPMGILVYFPWRLGAGLYDFFTFPFHRCDPCIIYPDYVTFSPEFLEKNNK